jgi:hypothetical protein
VYFFLCSEINIENDEKSENKGDEKDVESDKKQDDDPHVVEENDDVACKNENDEKSEHKGDEKDDKSDKK